MSRNKIIKFVHDRTGKTYADCRKICKCAHWNESTIIAYTLSDETYILTQTISQICAVVMDAAAQISKSLSIVFDNVADSMREQSERMRALAKPFDVNKDVFNYSDTVTASILNPSEVRTSSIVEDFKIAEMENRGLFEPLSIDELREQFGLQPIDVNDPNKPVVGVDFALHGENDRTSYAITKNGDNLPVACPDYATQDENGKLYQNEDEGI